MNAEQVFRAMRAEAIDRVLLVSPPYAHEDARSAFLMGYETALRDIAKGSLKVPS